MHDILPPSKRSRGHINPGKRLGGFEMRPKSLYQQLYSRHSPAVPIVSFVSVGDIMLPQLAQPHLLHTLTETDIYIHQEIEVIQGRPFNPEKMAILKRAHQIIKDDELKAKIAGFLSIKHGVIVLAVLLLLSTSYVTLDTITTNNQVKAATDQSQAIAANADPSTQTKADEGRDETKPTPALLKNYTVAPSLPRALYIDKLGIASRVMPMSVNKDGSVQAPRNIYDSGWYNGSVKPGEIGAMFIDGHASGPTREGLFAYLDRLVEGDTIQIERGDGSRLTYKVIHTETVTLDSLDMKKMLLPYGNALRGLNLMTCTGKWIESKQTFDKRVEVFAEQIS